MNETSTAPLVSIRQRHVPELGIDLHENALVHRLLAARGLQQRCELELALKGLPVPDKLPDIERAVDRLLLARDNNERVLIVGDYDCDGATSTVVALLGLQMLGFRQLDYVIPSRFEYGYGLSPAIVDIARSKYDAQLIVTVDNGVASVEGVAHAAKSAIDVVVTDHHLAPEHLPEAVAIVNPNMPGATFEGKSLAGVGVIFYTLLALRQRLKKLDDKYCQATLANLLDLVAIGTVADVVPLDGVNRILVEQGLRRIRGGYSRPGVVALLGIAGRQPQKTTTQDIGFGIGPRLNAAGRIDDMRVGVQCLLSDSIDQASQLATQLNSLNQSRQSIEKDMQSDAQAQLQALEIDTLSATQTYGICLKDESWHQGVIGILAGRIKEAAYKPVVIFTSDGPDHLKGSARSIPGVHIRDVLQNIVARNPGMIAKFGGHAMAAGLTLSVDTFDAFKHAFNEAVSQQLNGSHSKREYLTDGMLQEGDCTLENAQLLSRIMPWGQGFEAPLFSGEFRIVSQKVLGKGHLKLVLELCGSTLELDAIAFNQQPIAREGELLRAVYALDVNHFRGTDNLQLRVQYLEAAALR